MVVGFNKDKNSGRKIALFYKAKMKIVLLGPMSVGKTAICNRIKYNTYDPNYQVTIGAGITDYQYNKNGRQIDVQIWDTAGMERHRSLSPLYYRDSDAAIFVYDISDPKSIQILDSFYSQFVENNPGDFLGVLVANKKDLVDESYQPTEGIEWATEHNFEFHAVSAKCGVGVMEMFDKIIEKTITKLQASGKFTDIKAKKKKGKCC